MQNETWKPIVEYGDKYFVSSSGRVFSVKSNKILKPHKTSKGYFRVTLLMDGKRKNHRIHRLVANAFISNPRQKEEVNHKDGNKENNRVENLEWVTPCENANHAFQNGLRHTNIKGLRFVEIHDL